MEDVTVGVGVDIVEVARVERALTRTPSLVDRLFSPAEKRYCVSGVRPYERFAARFAAREAAAKALGVGFREVDPLDFEVTLDKAGRPHMELTGAALARAQELGVTEVAISLSHTHGNAIANAVAVTPAARPKQEEQRDLAQELAASFKQARSVLDELERVSDSGALEVAAAEAVGQEPVADAVAPEPAVQEALAQEPAVAAVVAQDGEGTRA
jgi:holo-[acyl-carrier protein] synthase